jgi:hypothetical protein
MKHQTPDQLLKRELLCFVRDSKPTVEEFIAKFGGDFEQVFHVLRKAEAILVRDGIVVLNPSQLSEDQQQSAWGRPVFCLDRDVIWISCAGPENPTPE